MDKEDTLLARWLSGDLTDEERQAVEADPDFEEVNKIINTVDTFAPPVFDKNAAWKKLSKEVGLPQEATIKTLQPKRQIKWWQYSAAAAILLLIASFFLLQNRLTTISTGAGEHIVHVLPDGSEVIINAGSTIDFSEKKWSEERIVKLKGEAFFKVKKGKNFLVQTNNGNVQVLGTSFNVLARKERLEVKCHTGKVGVTPFGEKEMQAILPGEGVIAVKGSVIQKISFDPKLQADKLYQQSSFSNTPLIEVLEEMERQYNITIDSPSNIGTKMYSGTFPHNHLETALKVVFEAMGLKYERIGDQKIQIIQ